MNPTGAYVGSEGLACALLADLVYAQPYRIRAGIGAIAGIRAVSFRTLARGNTRVLVATGDAAVYVVFRGTVFNSLRSWRVDLATGRRNWMDGKVHRGFLATLERSRPFAGARRAKTDTFGQPRTGNRRFCRGAEARLGRSCNRVVNRRDAVVGLPLVLQGYAHLRDFLHYGADGTIARYVACAGKNVGVTI